VGGAPCPGIDSPVAPFQDRPLAFAKAVPPECAKAASHPVLSACVHCAFGLSRQRDRPPKRRYSAGLHTTAPSLLPRDLHQNDPPAPALQPPWVRPFPVTRPRPLQIVPSPRPKLIAITRQTIDIDRATRNRPEAGASGIVTKITGMIHSSGKHALAWRFHQALAIRWPEPIRRAAHECFDPAHFRPTERIEFGKLDDPHTARLQRRILAA